LFSQVETISPDVHPARDSNQGSVGQFQAPFSIKGKALQIERIPLIGVFTMETELKFEAEPSFNEKSQTESVEFRH
jgi:hypothetical protein